MHDRLRLGFVGHGIFGRALADLAADAGLVTAAYDATAPVPSPRRAKGLGELARGSDVLILAVPVTATRAALTQLRPHLRPHHVVLDVGSVKCRPVEAMREVLGSSVPWAGTHPLFGPVSIARGERPLRVVVIPNPLHAEAAVRARALYERLGCSVLEQTAEDHDRTMAVTHALALFIAKGMLDVLEDRAPAFTTPSFQAVARVIDNVRADAGHLFLAIENENPFAAQARRWLVEALERVDAALAAEAARPAPETAPQPPAGAEVREVVIPGLGERNPTARPARELIDELDRELIELLGRRAQLSRRADAHAGAGSPTRDRSREDPALAARRTSGERRAWAEAAGVDPATAEAVFAAILGRTGSARRS